MKSLWFVPITFLALAAATVAAPITARVGSVRGEAQLVRNGQPAPLQSGTALQAGDTLVTGDGAEVRVVISDPAGELVLSPGAELRIDKLTATDTGIETILDAAITVPKGDLRGALGRLSDLSRFEITLGKCRHQVGVGKATRFALSADGTVRVRSGCITSLCDGKPGFSVCAGEKYVPTLGLTVAMTPAEISSPIWDVAQTGSNPTPSPGLGTPTVFVNPLIGASISPSSPPAP
jgi:hypothetical protein